MNIALFGFGNVGKALYEDEIKRMGTVTIIDPKYNKEKVDEKAEFDIAFIAVPTEMKSDGKVDTSIVEDVISKCNAKIIVIKSTVYVGFTDDMNEKYKNNIIFSPEYTGTTVHSPRQNFIALGGRKDLCKEVAEIYKRLYPADFEIILSDSKTAEMAKYMENCYLALKVTFCAEFYQASKQVGIDYDEVRNIFIKDKRVNPSHTNIMKDKPYYDSHCLNKDIPAFNRQFNLPLMNEVERINKLVKKYTS